MVQEKPKELEEQKQEEEQPEVVDKEATAQEKPKEPEEQKEEEEQPEVVEIIDLTVDDLKPKQYEIDQRAGKMVQALAREDLVSHAPKLLKKGAGGRIKYSSPKSDWKQNKTWEFTQIQVSIC